MLENEESKKRLAAAERAAAAAAARRKRRRALVRRTHSPRNMVGVACGEIQQRSVIDGSSSHYSKFKFL